MSNRSRGRRGPVLRVGAVLVAGLLGAGLVPGAVAAAAQRTDAAPVVGTWLYNGGAIEVTDSGAGAYVGVVTRATTLDRCAHPVGQRIWTMSGSGLTYNGTHIGYNYGTSGTECLEERMDASFSLGEYSGNGGVTTYSMRVCTTVGCATLDKEQPVDDQMPVVASFRTAGYVALGRRIPVGWSVQDNSGKAAWHVVLYSGGRVVGTGNSDGQVVADGTRQDGSFAVPAGAMGPFYFCVWAEDAAGNKSPAAPESSCQWLSVQVKPDGSIVNGCGGAQWGDAVAAVQNWLLDSQTYGGKTVSFRAACNAHDAGYAGITVYDPFQRKVIDFRTWSRLKVDNKFYDDIGALCRAALDNAKYRKYLWRCESGNTIDKIVGWVRPGARAYYEAVRAYAEAAFDTDATEPGTQTRRPSVTFPAGGIRNNR